MKANNSVSSQILGNAIFTWLHLFLLISVYSIFYALFRTVGYSEFAAYTFSSIYVVVGVVIPNIYLSGENTLSAKLAFLTKFVLVPSILSGGCIVAFSPSGRALIEQLLMQINYDLTNAPFLVFSILLSALALIVAVFSSSKGAWQLYQMLRRKTLTHSIVKVQFSRGKTKRYFLNLEEPNFIVMELGSWSSFVLTTSFSENEVVMKFRLLITHEANFLMVVRIPISGSQLLEPILDVEDKKMQFERVDKFNFIVRVDY